MLFQINSQSIEIDNQDIFDFNLANKKGIINGFIVIEISKCELLKQLLNKVYGSIMGHNFIVNGETLFIVEIKDENYNNSTPQRPATRLKVKGI